MRQPVREFSILKLRLRSVIDPRSLALLYGPWRRAVERVLEPLKKCNHWERHHPKQKEGWHRQGGKEKKKERERGVSFFSFPISLYDLPLLSWKGRPVSINDRHWVPEKSAEQSRKVIWEQHTNLFRTSVWWVGL